MKLLLITGAGASRNLSVDPDNPLPLMSHWASRLCDDIGQRMAAATGLANVKTTAEFEETLGAIFQWFETISLAERFSPLAGKSVGDASNSQPRRSFDLGLRNMQIHIKTLREALHDSLFREFGPDRIDRKRAAEAYRELLVAIREEAGEDDPAELVCATTNYDHSQEDGLSGLGMNVRSCFPYDSIRPRVLKPDGLGEFVAGEPSLLALHGGVGWYKRDGVVEFVAPARPFNKTLGVPAVLYPSPNKNVQSADTVGVWKEFATAVKGATHILVLGHSLHDEHLVAEIRKATCPVGVTIYPPDVDGKPSVNDASSSPQADEIRKLLPSAHVIGIDFGNSLEYEKAALSRWCQGRSKPAVIQAA